MSSSLSALSPPPPPSSSSFSSSSSSSTSSARARLQLLLQTSSWLGSTTPHQRLRLPQSLLIQRNLEIQAQLLLIDEEYDAILSAAPASEAAAMLAGLDQEADELAQESDEIETRLYEKFHVRGGGRVLVLDEMQEAGMIGEQLGRGTRATMAGKPRPLAPSLTGAGERKEREEKAERKEEPQPPPPAVGGADTGDDAAPSASPLSSPFSPTHPPSTRRRSRGRNQRRQPKRPSRSDRAMLARLNAQADANEASRKERAEVNKEGLLGRLYAFFDEWVDSDRAQPQLTDEEREERRRRAADKRKAVARSFPYILGTLTFPLFPLSDAPRDEKPQDKEGKEEGGRRRVG